MSLIIDLTGKKEEFKIMDRLNYLNQELKSIGISNNPLIPQTIPKNSILPWLRLRPSDLFALTNLFLEIKADPTWTEDDSLTFVGASKFFPDLAQDIFKDKPSHLISHYNVCGYYVPLDFENLTVTDDFLRYIGSSVCLDRELREMADRINLDLGNYTPDLETLYKERIDELENDFFCFEKFLILYLHNFCLASIKHNLIIEFG